MLLKEVLVEGFRNFKECKVAFNQKTLIIGPNDIGKSNLIYAMRLLLDKSFSENDLEPDESDFYAHENTAQIKITLFFSGATEDCIRSKFKENIGSNGDLVIRYVGLRSGATSQKRYEIYAGPSLDNLKEFESRFYLRALNLSYINSNRDLLAFIKREKRNLLQQAKDQRTAAQILADDVALKSVESSLTSVSTSVSKLTYIESATIGLNKELGSLSVSNSNLSVFFDSGASDPAAFVDNLQLASKYKDKSVALGGDGRSNQIYLALWAAQRDQAGAEPLEVTINCIEEPEAHLHPHQQRKLAEYLIANLGGQVILTTHSPQITCEFESNSIVSLFNNSPDTKAANEGCAASLGDAVLQFGHRLNIVPAEGFFSSCVLLVEGVSEILFYRALAGALKIDLDRLNISLISVDGLSFSLFKRVYGSLRVQTVVRTDNDIIKKPKTTKYRAAGVQRLIALYEEMSDGKTPEIDALISKVKPVISDLIAKEIPTTSIASVGELLSRLESYNLYLAETALESDLISSPIVGALKKHFECDNEKDLLEAMTDRKGGCMFSFLKENAASLSGLAKHRVATPLFACEKIAKSIHG